MPPKEDFSDFFAHMMSSMGAGKRTSLTPEQEQAQEQAINVSNEAIEKGVVSPNWTNLDPDTKLSIIDEVKKFCVPCPFEVGDIVFQYRSDVQHDDQPELPLFAKMFNRYKRPMFGELAIVVAKLEPFSTRPKKDGEPYSDDNMIIALVDPAFPDGMAPDFFSVNSYYFYRKTEDEK